MGGVGGIERSLAGSLEWADIARRSRVSSSRGLFPGAPAKPSLRGPSPRPWPLIPSPLPQRMRILSLCPAGSSVNRFSVRPLAPLRANGPSGRPQWRRK